MIKRYFLNGGLMIAVFIIGISMGSVVFAGGSDQPGTDYDPLVAKSYLQQEVQSRTALLQEKIQELQSEVTRLQSEVNSLQKQLGNSADLSHLNTTGNDSNVLENVNEEETAQNPKYGYVNTEAGVNLRTGPSTSYERIKTLPYQTRVKIVAENNGWYQLEVENETGWVSAEFISE